MALRDKDIENLLENEFSDEENVPNDECSEVESNIDEQEVVQEDCGSDSEIDGEENLASSEKDDSEPPPNLADPVSAASDFSSEDDLSLEQLRRKKNYFGKNRFRWASVPSSSRTRTLEHNIVREREGIKPEYRDQINSSSSPLDIWKLFFTDAMLEKIVLYTNKKIREIRTNYQKQSCVQDVDLIELKAFIGFLFYTAIFKENHEHYTSWYSMDGTGREIYRCILSKNRFEVLLKTIRFDDSETRQARREQDPSAPICELFDSFINCCQAVYAIGSFACIDEMLLAFRGRCRFKMYMPKKPAKYGIKIQCLTDARSGYLLNAYIYLGKDSDGLNLSAENQRLKKPTQAVLRLISPIEGSNRNITTDNWYTSIELLEQMKKKKLTVVGTLRKNQREIPPEFLPSRNRSVDTTVFGFTKDITISSYVPKKNKAVITVSSMHHTANIDDTTKKPEIILHYNQTKIGVDLLDQRCANYSTGRRTRRWPLAVFYRLLDISASNCYIVSLSAKGQTQKPESRFKFLKKLAEQLTRPHMERRENNPQLQRHIKMSLRRVMHHKDDAAAAKGPGGSHAEERLAVRKTCSTCDPKKKRRTQYVCFECKQPICLECSNKLCNNCSEKI